MFDGNQINFLIAFAAGVATFFTSCLLPLVPTYLAYLSGVALNKSNEYKSEILLHSVLFTAGFIFVFILLGVTATSIGLILKQYSSVVQFIGGLFMIFVGLFILGLFEFDFLYGEKRVNINYSLIKNRKLKSFLFGLTFGFAWTPCIGPVLGVILFWASQIPTRLEGTLLLFAYGIGLGLPFIFVGQFFDKVKDKIKSNSRAAWLINKSAGVIILISGILLASGKLGLFSIAAVKLLKINPYGF